MLLLKQIVKRFNKTLAVDHLSLEIPKGIIFGLLGPNGAGKTTTIRMIMDIIQPDEGEILFDNLPISRDFLQKTGYLPEERGLYQKSRLKETIAYFAKLKGMNEPQISVRIDQLLSRFDLMPYSERKIEELSKGNQQKVQFIISIIHDPDLLILDEPFSGLDPVNQILLKEIISELKNQGTTVLFSTHQMEQVEQLCDEICLINHGKNILSGNLKEIKTRHGEKIVEIGFSDDSLRSDSINFLDEAVVGDKVITGKMPPGKDPNEILRKALEICSVSHFTLKEPSLESIFINLVKGEN